MVYRVSELSQPMLSDICEESLVISVAYAAGQRLIKK